MTPETQKRTLILESDINSKVISVKKSLLFSFSLIGTIGFATAVPLAGLSLLGRYLDGRFGTEPALFWVGLVFGSIIAFFSVKQIATDAVEKLNKLTEKK